jgi:hypothetical protein
MLFEQPLPFCCEIDLAMDVHARQPERQPFGTASSMASNGQLSARPSI